MSKSVRKNSLTEEQPPTARVEPRVWNGKPGDRHQFKCITTGIPTPKVRILVWIELRTPLYLFFCLPSSYHTYAGSMVRTQQLASST